MINDNKIQALYAVYGAVFLVILLVINIIYVAYSFKIKKFTYMWPLILLRNVV